MKYRDSPPANDTNWITVYDAYSGYNYWFNNKTYISSWDVPHEIAVNNYELVDFKSMQPLYETVYFSQLDPTKNKLYYIHSETHDVTWEKPEVVLQAEKKELNDKHDKHSAVKRKWSKIFDNQSGSYYYYNLFSGESQWDKPEQYFELR